MAAEQHIANVVESHRHATPQQVAAICEQIKVYYQPDTPSDGLADVFIVPEREMADLRAGYEADDDPRGMPVDLADGVCIARFSYIDGEDGHIGLEETAFAADGSVVTSQDLG